MTAIQYVEYILSHNWEEDVDGRVHPVPEPRIKLEKDDPKDRLRTHDVLRIQDGGVETRTPRGVGYNEEDATSLVTVILKTTESRERLEGHRDSNNDAESYGGLKGEVKRILELNRKHPKEFSLVEGFEWKDQLSLVGKGLYRGSWEVRLQEIGATMDPPTG